MSLKKIIASTLAAGVLLPMSAFAQTTTPSIQALLDQIKALQAKIVDLQTQQNVLVQERNDVFKSLLSTLKQGVEGDDVKVLQALLAADSNIYPEGRITGFFGPLTALAVKRFQHKHGLEQVGHVGPKTLAKLNELLGKSPIALETSSSTPGMHRKPCVPPGHMIAPGWLKKVGNDTVVPPCKNPLPPGIAKKLPGFSTTTPPVADTTAPSLSNIVVSGISAVSAMISWNTNENATSKVYYATTSPVDLGSASTASSASLMMTHSLSLSSLTASTTYYYVLESRDAAGNTATTSTASFLTL